VSGVNLSGSTIKCDLSGPHEVGVTGSVWGMIGVHIDSSWGYVGLQKDKSAQSTLESLQSMIVELDQDSEGKAAPVKHFHHDDDKTFRGVVEEWVRSQGWKDRERVQIIY
jgi:hypothetical protein